MAFVFSRKRVGDSTKRGKAPGTTRNTGAEGSTIDRVEGAGRRKGDSPPRPRIPESSETRELFAAHPRLIIEPVSDRSHQGRPSERPDQVRTPYSRSGENQIVRTCPPQ